MNKIKKVFISFGVFFIGLVSKVFASITLHTELKYGVFEPEPTIGEKILLIGKFIIPVVLFFIGMFVVFSKKLTKKVKSIVIVSLIIVAIISVMLINYFTYQQL